MARPVLNYRIAHARKQFLAQLQLTLVAATATGWGNTSFRGRLSPDLLKVTLPILSNAMCNNIFWRQGFDKNIMLCAGEIDSDENTCHVSLASPSNF